MRLDHKDHQDLVVHLDKEEKWVHEAHLVSVVKLDLQVVQDLKEKVEDQDQ